MGAAAAVRAGDPLLTERTAELWRECVARLDDDDPRHILADALQGEGDPRGELMMLQLMPADPENAPARRARIRELLKQYYRVWLGPLCDIACGASFERGMLKRLELCLPTDRERWRSADYHDKELASVEEVLPPSSGWNIDHASRHQLYRSAITDPRLISLRHLDLDEAGQLHGLALPAWPRHVALAAPSQPAFELHLQYIAANPEIESIAISGQAFDRIATLPWFARLTSLTLATTVARGLAVWSRLPATMALVIQPGTSADSCEQRSPHDVRLELRRDGVARVAGEWVLQSLDVLAALPAGFHRLEVEDTSESIVERIRTAIAERDIEVTLRGLIGRAGNIRWGYRT